MNLYDYFEEWTGDAMAGDDALLMLGTFQDRLPAIPAKSLDGSVTDPTYHLDSITKRFGKKGSKAVRTKPGNDAVFGRHAKGFMGLEWDAGNVAFRQETWDLIHGRLKHGAHLGAFGHPKTSHWMSLAMDLAGLEHRERIAWLYSSGMNKGTVKLDGPDVQTLLKPQHEDIMVMRCALSTSTVTAQYAENGMGGMNFGECMVEAPKGDREDYGLSHGPRAGFTGHILGKWNARAFDYKRDPRERLPSNVCIDEHVAEALGDRSKFYPTFYYLKKPGRKERDIGCEGLRLEKMRRMNDGGLRDSESRFADVECKNTHATVKPLNLVRWLVRLLVPPGGIVLDPFMGSGTTGMAALLEGRRFIGVEMVPKHFEIAKCRVRWARQYVAEHGVGAEVRV